MNDRRRRSELFGYIRTIWSAIDEHQREKIHSKLIENICEIIEADPMKAYKLFCTFFQMDLARVLKLISKNDTAQYGILKVNQFL